MRVHGLPGHYVTTVLSFFYRQLLTRFRLESGPFSEGIDLERHSGVINLGALVFPLACDVAVGPPFLAFYSSDRLEYRVIGFDSGRNLVSKLFGDQSIGGVFCFFLIDSS